MSECILELPQQDLDQELTFEVSRDYKITTRVTYKKGEIIDSLVNEINKLKRVVSSLKRGKSLLVTEEILIKEWDNDEDERWNQL